MPQTKRRHYRVPVTYQVVFYWEDASGAVYTARPRARDVSGSGMRVESDVAIACGTSICVEVPQYSSAIEAVVRHCSADGAAFRIGVEFSLDQPQLGQAAAAGIDYYEILQLSAAAEIETIHRVYRIMAARFHPDNPESGDAERFLLLSEAYRILSDPARRAEYDRLREQPVRALPLFQAKAFVDEKEGEHNRRLGVLCLLYSRRRRNPEGPTIGLMELEELMSIPREYLEFTLWYLRQKKYVQMGQGADYELTADGVDFVERHTDARNLLMRLLGAGRSATVDDSEFMRSGGMEYASVQ